MLMVRFCWIDSLYFGVCIFSFCCYTQVRNVDGYDRWTREGEYFYANHQRLKMRITWIFHFQFIRKIAFPMWKITNKICTPLIIPLFFIWKEKWNGKIMTLIIRSSACGGSGRIELSFQTLSSWIHNINCYKLDLFIYFKFEHYELWMNFNFNSITI